MKLNNNKYFAITAVIATAMAATSVFAAGGGGGGSVPSCTQDTWSCGQWSDCSAAGTQNRTCTLSFDCSTADTPSPAQQQSCTPPPTPTPSSSTNTPTPALQLQKTTTPAATCKKDTWTCSGWSKTCDVNGDQTRTCTKTVDCATADTPMPATTQRCDHLQCGDKPEMKDRISCRLELAPAGVARELELQYLPEECRALKNKADQETCETKYKSFKPCWNIPAGDARFACAEKALGINSSTQAAINSCKQLSGNEQKNCLANVRKQTLDMIKFRFYDLEQRAEDLWSKGASVQNIADFVIFSEGKKQDFNKAITNAQRKQIILDVRGAWQNFNNKIKNQIK